MRKTLAMAALAAFGFAPAAVFAQPEPLALSFIHPEEWETYRAAYVTEEGRVIDTANAEISHSEGQGYGLLLAYLAQDRATFERIWSFTGTELMLRDDGLAAWLWDPEATPHVADTNNATDGDILIAYALALAGAAWGDPGKIEQARDIARTVGDTLLLESHGLTMVLPAEYGFTALDQPDGPVVNLSYWVFEAFPVLAELTPEIDWMDVHDDGLALIGLTTGEGEIPPDWIALGDDAIAPAENFDPEFSYNNIRVPLYLMRARAETDLIARFAPAFDADFAPGRIDVVTGERLETMGEAGYRLIGAALACVAEGTPVPHELQALDPTTYYSATLQLLALAHLRHYHNDCLDGGAPDPLTEGPES